LPSEFSIGSTSALAGGELEAAGVGDGAGEVCAKSDCARPINMSSEQTLLISIVAART
jgi:hypothetical protein